MLSLGGLDLKVGPLVAAFFGAMAYAVVLKVKRPVDLASIVIVGIGVSYFLGPLIAIKIGEYGFSGVSPEGLQNAAGFISGLGGMAICNGCIAVTRVAMRMIGNKIGGE